MIPTTGRCSARLPVDPWNPALPNEKIPPSEPTSQYPWVVVCGPAVVVTVTTNGPARGATPIPLEATTA